MKCVRTDCCREGTTDMQEWSKYGTLRLLEENGMDSKPNKWELGKEK